MPWHDGRLQAPHATLWIVARGINIGLHTRMYFEDEAEANAEDPFLSRIEHQSRVPTLLARRTGPGAYRFADYLKLGVPLTLFVGVVVLVVLPLFWPLHG